MSHSIQLSSELYRILQQRAAMLNASIESLVESAIRLQYGNTLHIEQRQTAHGPQAYLRGTRVAVRHVVAFLKAGHSLESIVAEGLPDVPPAAIYEALAYYHDHQDEIEAELLANSQEAGQAQLEALLPPELANRLTGQSV